MQKKLLFNISCKIAYVSIVFCYINLYYCLAIDLSHTSAILYLKRGSVGYTVVTTQPWIWVTVVFPECKSIYRGIHLTYLSFNQIPNQEKDTTLG